MKVKTSASRRLFLVFNYLLLTLLSLSFLIPFCIVISSSFVGNLERNVRGSFVLLPHSPELTAYRMLLTGNTSVFRAYSNTLYIVVVGTALSLLVTAMLGYGLTKKSMPGRNLFVTLIFITMIFGGGMIPTYLLVDRKSVV